MKTLITATILTLSASNASAIENYGDFASPDNSPEFDTVYGVEFSLPSPASADFEVSLYGLLAGNPDSGTGVRIKTGPRVEIGDIVSFAAAADDSGV